MIIIIVIILKLAKLKNMILNVTISGLNVSQYTLNQLYTFGKSRFQINLFQRLILISSLLLVSLLSPYLI